ncbi:probable insulin-like peptide 7 [Scaptodrosophila lebanonensis]|uniref:Probable insulin-like peptide 7 n=1 Tax=Drosophila lebanonensis TaxID=7225 RepID=A0A6J2TYX2_DROLE|nr:probable insulin-like peptide 7 [Scaptodrosophila lebanonensis]
MEQRSDQKVQSPTAHRERHLCHWSRESIPSIIIIMQLRSSLTLRSTFLLLALQLLHTPHAIQQQHTEEGLELLFRERSQSDWENVWHRETHSRCRDKLVRQLYWACEKDIYRLTRRNRKRTGETVSKRTAQPSTQLASTAAASTWLHVNYANMLLRTRRADAPSITNECCTKAGCTWEEYAEYCPSNKRRNHY